MSDESKKIYFQEEWNYFVKKRMKKLGLGVILFVLPPIFIYFMIFELFRWSSLFEKEIGQIVIFLTLSPFLGLYFTFKALLIPRIKIFEDRITNPAIFGNRYIPLADIEQVIVVFDQKEPLKVELKLNPDSVATRDKQISLGWFFESDRARMMETFRRLNVKTGLRAAAFDEREDSIFE